MLTLRGRIVDIWQEDSSSWIELVIRDERRLLRLDPSAVPPAERGAIVDADVEAAGTVVGLTIVGQPVSGAWDAAGDALRWRRFGDAPSRLALLVERDRMVRAIRGHLQDEGFLEVHAPLLVRGTCPDPHIQSFQVADRYLSTSTEYQLKRLIVGGAERVFTLTQNFRAGDSGRMHNPEFTMLEWARAAEPLEVIEQDAIQLVCEALEALDPGADSLSYGEHTVRVQGVPWRRLTVAEALREHLGMEVDEACSPGSLRRACEDAKIEGAEPFLDDAGALLSALLDRVTPLLGAQVPVFLRGWPAFMTSSAESSSGVAERSELFIAGVELSDGFAALRDPAAQRASFQAAQERRRAAGRGAVELDEAYLAALDQGLPPVAGMALGVDRLAMLLLGETEIRRVIPFAWDEL